jgi:drug/metabolite transporter (DMT)-like permease
MFLIYAFISLVGWGIGDVFSTIASRKLGSFNTAFYAYLISAIYGLIFVPFSLSYLPHLTVSLVLLTVFLAIIQSLGFFAFSEGLKVGNSSLVGTIAGAFTSLVVILSVLFLGDRLNGGQILAIIVIFLGLFFSSIHLKEIKNIHSVINRGTFYAFVALIGWGIYFTFIKIPVEHAGFFWPSMITNLAGTIFFFVLGPKKITFAKHHRRKGIPAALLAGILGSTASFAFNYAIGKGMTSVVAPISGAYPALFALLAYYYFKDPLSNQQKMGMVVTLGGIVLLSYLSG